MKKAFVSLLIIAFVGIALGSCVKEVITYCPFCGQAGIKEVSKYNKDTGLTTIYYECQNSKCGKKFGAGQPETTGDKE
jgi:ribosomal protein L44E